MADWQFPWEWSARDVSGSLQIPRHWPQLCKDQLMPIAMFLMHLEIYAVPTAQIFNSRAKKLWKRVIFSSIFFPFRENSYGWCQIEYWKHREPWQNVIQLQSNMMLKWGCESIKAFRIPRAHNCLRPWLWSLQRLLPPPRWGRLGCRSLALKKGRGLYSGRNQSLCRNN